MKTVFIDNRSTFFEDVKHWKERTLPHWEFIPDGGFEDHARNKNIICNFANKKGYE